MSTLQKQTFDKFLQELSAAQIEMLRAMLAQGKPPKPDELSKIFTRSDKDEIARLGLNRRT